MWQHFYKQCRQLWLSLKAFSLVIVLYLENIKIECLVSETVDYDHDNSQLPLCLSLGF